MVLTPRDLLRWVFTKGVQSAFPCSDQRILISRCVVATMWKYRQQATHSLEAGGQLFGKVSPLVVHVIRASEPTRTDVRTTRSFRSDPRAAQQRIDRYGRRGLIYLGEWHTHPVPTPSPSNEDYQAVETLYKRSTLRTNGLLMVIMGTAPPPDGLALLSFIHARWVRLP